MRILHLILARGRSKGIPRKNLQEIGGIPLVGFKAIAAKRSRSCSKLILSSDCPEIQEVGRLYGAETPFARPTALASDGSPSAHSIAHAMDWIERNTEERYDAVMLHEPSSPFTRPEDLDGAVELMESRSARAVVGVKRAPVSSVFIGPLDREGRLTAVIDKMKHIDSVRRQDHEEYTMNGALYLFRWDHFKAHGDIYQDRDATFGYVMPDTYSIEIDEPLDLEFTRFLVDRGHVDMRYWR